jgi:hypothetical protein
VHAAVEVTWVRVQKPVLDLVSLIVGSLELTGVFALVALTLGTSLGIFLIVRRIKRPHHLPRDDVSLHTDGTPLPG